MKNISGSIVLLALVILSMGLAFTAGCTGTTTPLPEEREVSWTGVWIDTSVDRGALRLAQDGDSVSGTYIDEDSTGTMTGTVSGDGSILTGTWFQEGFEGTFTLTMAPGQEEFTGWWIFYSNTGEPMEYPWTGIRAPPISWTGVWLDDVEEYGRMTLVQDGDAVSGVYTYEDDQGTVAATVSDDGYLLTGIWSDDEDEGPFEFRMEDCQVHFTGWWMYDIETNDTTQYPWNGIRAPDVSWTGVWDDPDGEGNITLVQDGKTVSGTYMYDDIPGTVTATISDGGFTLNGIWSDDEDMGAFGWTMANNQNAFTGWWMYDIESGDTTKYPWDGIRAERD